MGFGLVGAVVMAGVLVGVPGSAQAAGPTCTQSLATDPAPRANTYTVTPGHDGSMTCGLVRGDTGEGVRAMQRTLNKCYSTLIAGPLTEDGQFGAKTADAVYQANLTLQQGSYEYNGDSARYWRRRANHDGTNTFAYCYTPNN